MVKRTVRILLAFNVICIIWFLINHDSLPLKATESFKEFRQGISTKSASSIINRLTSKLSFGKVDCHKSIVIFGMRHHWRQFCTEHYPCMSLVEFPRRFGCRDLECSVTIDYTDEPQKIGRFDVVAFTDVYAWMTGSTWEWLHGNRTQTQRWVMISQESPEHSLGFEPPAKYADVSYDWFSSYKTDSDIPLPYGYYEPFAEDEIDWELNVRIFLHNKTQLVSWLGSNCDGRVQTVENLKKLIHVDTYGKCGDGAIAWDDRKAMFNTLQKYRFYLSFENSCCDDYITEKFWRTLEMGVVPIVMGASLEQYTRLAPPKSFIHAEQFASLNDLGAYILELQVDDYKYLEYFEWKKFGKVISHPQEEQYIRPLKDSTHCGILKKYLKTEINDQSKLEYFGEKWFGSCRQCPSLQVLS